MNERLIPKPILYLLICCFSIRYVTLFSASMMTLFSWFKTISSTCKSVSGWNTGVNQASVWYVFRPWAVVSILYIVLLPFPAVVTAQPAAEHHVNRLNTVPPAEYVCPGITFSGIKNEFVSCIKRHKTTPQRPENNKSPSGIRYWAHYSYGITTQGPGCSASIGMDINRHVFSLRTSAANPVPVNDIWDIAFLYGRSVLSNPFYLAGGVGASVVAGNQYSRLIGGTTRRTFEPMIGFPLEGHLSWTLSPYLATGVYSFVNINTKQPFGGITASVRIGIMPHSR